MLPNFFCFPVLGDWYCLLKVPISDKLTKLLWFLNNKIHDTSLFLFENWCWRNLFKNLQHFSSNLGEICKASNVTLLIIFHDWYLMFLKEVECSIWRNAGVRAISFNYSIEVNSYVSIFDEMLKFWITTIFPYHSFSGKLVL